MLFGQFVGAWDIDVTNIAADGTTQEFKGEWHFGWVLEGRAIMDVWITPRRSLLGQAASYEYGATLRFFDPTIQPWRSTWIGPVRHRVRAFIARQVKDEIILEGSFEGRRIRWIFSQVTAALRRRPVYPCGLTAREVQVLRLVAQGLTNSEVAKALGLSEKTIAHHLTHIFNKTTSENRAAAVAFAIRHDLA